MAEYRDIKRPEALKALPFTMEDVPVLSRNEETNIGITSRGPGYPNQLNIRHSDNMTYVQPMGADHSVLPWKFTGYVSPADCRAWYEANGEASAGT